VQADNAFKDYFPSKLSKGKLPDKGFFWGVIFTVKPGYAKCLMKDAIESRNALPLAAEQDATKVLQIESEIMKKMLQAPIFMSKST
jgi:hypothetical protein